MNAKASPPPTPAQLREWAAGIRAGDRAILARAITLVESHRPDHARAAAELLEQLPPRPSLGIRVGITGIPGVGKSTFLNALGSQLCDSGQHRVAVLAVDPTSQRTGGSILGDKTRMDRLAHHEAAFVRPSPTGTSLGGVARRTREVMQLCEAAGHDVVFVETVGVGQSEVAVAELVDTFLLLLIGGAGDELQGIKRGIVELADVLVVNKADGDQAAVAKKTATEYGSALRILRAHGNSWMPPVLTASARDGHGLGQAWQSITDHRSHLGEDGIIHRRNRQALHWFDEAFRELAETVLLEAPGVAGLRERLRASLAEGTITVSTALQAIRDRIK